VYGGPHESMLFLEERHQEKPTEGESTAGRNIT
jgi:hypothetical protein